MEVLLIYAQFEKTLAEEKQRVEKNMRAKRPSALLAVADG